MVKLKLYDILGCEIQILISEQQNSGLKTISFELRNIELLNIPIAPFYIRLRI